MNFHVLSLDKLVSQALNNWGTREISLVKVLSEYLVYLVILIASLWIASRTYRATKPFSGFKFFIRELLFQGLLILAIPVLMATAISEIISMLIPRKRPFAAMEQIQLLIPHSADGGMPSHHVVFMASVALAVYSINRQLGAILLGVAVISGVGRVSAGIHYPTDVLAGIALAGSINFLYQIAVNKFFGKGAFRVFERKLKIEGGISQNNASSGL